MGTRQAPHLASVQPGGLLDHDVTTRLPARSPQFEALANQSRLVGREPDTGFKTTAERLGALLEVEVVTAGAGQEKGVRKAAH